MPPSAWQPQLSVFQLNAYAPESGIAFLYQPDSYPTIPTLPLTTIQQGAVLSCVADSGGAVINSTLVDMQANGLEMNVTFPSLDPGLYRLIIPPWAPWWRSPQGGYAAPAVILFTVEP